MNASGNHFIIPVFIPHNGCPNTCVFCNQMAITGVKTPPPMDPDHLLSHVHTYLGYRKEKIHTEIAFFGGNFLGLEKKEVDSLLDAANRFVLAGQVDGIRFSTRPDTIDPARLEHIMTFPITTVELGAQSMDDAVLAGSNRGHSSRDTVRAHSLLKRFGLRTGLQMMVGLPGDDGSSSVYTAEKLAGLNPDYIRIYPTIVLKGSLLSKWYKNGTYEPLELEESVTLVKHLYYIFKRKNIRVIRMGLQASEDLNQGAEIIAGPYHPAFGHLVLSSVFYDMARHELKQRPDVPRHIVISVHPRNISRLQGLNKKNIPALKKEFHLASLDIKGDRSLSDNDLSVNPAG